MRYYLNEALQQPDSEDPFEPVPSQAVANVNISGNNFPGQRPSMSKPMSKSEDMSRSWEEHLIKLFWQSYYITVPILNEKDFREHYNTLWTATFSPIEAKRKPSALVDSILALCAQYGTAFVVAGKSNAEIKDDDDVSFAGHELYRRSQQLLSGEYEAPTISTLQCLIYSVLYLCNASLMDSGRQTLAVAIGLARKLGVQYEAGDKSSAARPSLHRRIWWTLFLLDSQICLGFGRPYLINSSNMTCDLTSGGPSEVTDFGSNLSLAFADINWLAFHTQCIKLIVTVRTIHTSFIEKCSELCMAHKDSDLYDNLDLLESCSEHLLRSMKGLHDWVRNVPDELKNPRKGTEQPFSTARSAIELDPYLPLWLQRQRLLLELLYHNLTMSLHRPFIRFPSSSVTAFQTSVDRGVSCLSHAIVTTSILNQALTEGDILNGWQQAHQYQWDATLSMLGFGLAHPVCPHSPSARRAILTSITNFDMLGVNKCSITTNTGAVTRNILDKIDLFTSSFRNKPTSSGQSAPLIRPRTPFQMTPVNSPPVPQHLRASPQNQGLQLATSRVPYTWPATSDITPISSSPGSLKNSSDHASSASTDFSVDMLGTFEESTLLPYHDLASNDFDLWSDWGHAAQEHNETRQTNWINNDQWWQRGCRT